MDFRGKLIEQRRKCGLSQEQLAEKLGVSRQAVSRWETENTLPDAYNLKRISKLFHVSIDYLLAEDDCVQGEGKSRNGIDQDIHEASEYKRLMFWSVFLITFGLLGILVFYILSTQIPATVMLPEPVSADTVQMETNIMTQNAETLYTPQKVYSFFPFLVSYHLRGVAAGFACLTVMGVLLLLYCLCARKGIFSIKSHILPKKKEGETI